AFPTACPQVGGCPQAPQATTIGYSISNSKPIVQTHTSIGIDYLIPSRMGIQYRFMTPAPLSTANCGEQRVVPTVMFMMKKWGISWVR
ncbi:MAG: hypothetical protein ACREYE_29200, partial [Gammaproteobacteria bacterium]